MPNDKSSSNRSILRLFFWEGLALTGLAIIHYHQNANHIWNLNFFYNALFFLVAYPLLYVYRWKMAEGCLGTMLWPFSYLLNWLLGVSAFLWTAFGLFMADSPFYYKFIDHEIIFGILFVFIYFPLIQPLWGTGKKYYSLVELLWILVYSALGGFLGYVAGWFFSNKFPSVRTDTGHWFLLWLGFILLGTAIGAMVAQRREK